MPRLETVSADFADEARHVVRVEQTVAASPADVWNIITDNSTWTTWFPTMTRCETTSEVASGVGATRQVKVGALRADELFILWDESSSWAFSVTDTNLPLARKMLERLDLHDVGTTDSPHTRVTYTGAFEPHPLSALTFGLVRRSVNKTWKRGLSGLSQHTSR